ncbi:MAG: NifU N-terminal domain-containing protein [Rhodothermales bacterium]
MIELLTHPTPNPNSLKITAPEHRFIESGMESFNSSEEATKHPLGRRLFVHSGVANVLILPDFLTITKEPSADWTLLLPEIEQTLRSYFEDHGARA